MLQEYFKQHKIYIRFNDSIDLAGILGYFGDNHNTDAKVWSKGGLISYYEEKRASGAIWGRSIQGDKSQTAIDWKINKGYIVMTSEEFYMLMDDSIIVGSYLGELLYGNKY